VKVTCPYSKSVTHEYPDDWNFGGPGGTHPGADKRYTPEVYVYFDTDLNVVWRTTMMTCDEMALAFRASAESMYRCTILAVQRLVKGGKAVSLYVRNP